MRPSRASSAARCIGPAFLRAAGRAAAPAAGDLAEELLLGGQRVVPEKALKHGFVFRHPTLRAALAAILGTHAADNSRPAPEGNSALRHAGL